MGWGLDIGEPGLSLKPLVDLMEWALKLEKNDDISRWLKMCW